MTARPLIPIVFAASVWTSAAAPAAADWPWWRGPNHDGIADPNQDPPVEFSADKNVRWVADVPGRGHGSPSVAGDRVFLAAADEVAATQMLLCFDRGTGAERWSTVVHGGGLPETNKKASHASSTPACDGDRVFINFVSGGAAHLTALSLDGGILWQREISPYVVHQGYGSSPVIYGQLVIVAADNKSGGAIAAFERATGEPVWRVERPELPNYPTPVVHRIGGRDQLLMQGCELVSSFDPATGEKIWEFEGATTECVTTIVTDGTHVFTSGGYPKNHVAAVLADGTGEVVWENTNRVYVPSMIVHDGHLYAVGDNGVANCWDGATGERKWRERLGRGASGSPVMVGDRIYCGDETGQFFVFRADPDRFEILAENQLGDETLSTPAICGGQVFARVAFDGGGSRQEKLFCLERAGH